MTRRPTALVTGGSRGIGAEVATLLAASGCDIVLCYREKHKRATAVKRAVEMLGSSCRLISGDLAEPKGLERMIQQLAVEGPYASMILAASGGLEQGKDLPYAMAINCYAALALTTALLPCCLPKANIVYVTSHGAHFYHQQPVLPMYERVALSKQAGERCLERMRSLFSRYDVRLKVVSGDIIEGTTTASLIDRVSPGFVQRRKEQVGRLPSIAEFAKMIVDEVRSERIDKASPHLSLCGSIEPYQVEAVILEGTCRIGCRWSREEIGMVEGRGDDVFQ